MLFDSKKLLRKALRLKLLSDRYPCKSAFHFEAGIFRVAPAFDYHLARLAGMKDFWKLAPQVGNGYEALIPSCDKTDAGYGEWCFACVRDGDGETYIPGIFEIVGRNDSCVWFTPNQLRCKIDQAQGKARARNEDGDKIHNGNFATDIHEANYTK